MTAKDLIQEQLTRNTRAYLRTLIDTPVSIGLPVILGMGRQQTIPDFIEITRSIVEDITDA
jgi:hypothetical protein